MSPNGDTHPSSQNGIVRVGIVSDTHGLLRTELEEAFSGVDVILHAGDVGSLAVLDQLAYIAPVHAVMGNVDGVVTDLDLPVYVRFARAGVQMLVTHYIGEPDGLLAPVAEELIRGAAHIVISGHTHRAALTVRNGRLYANPGSAGARRYGLPASCALLTLSPQGSGTRVEAQVLNLDEGGVLSEEALTIGKN